MIDILLSTYNGALYINDFIESLLQQTYTNWHLWIRDDHSTDETCSIIQKYTNQYPNCISQLKDDYGNVGFLKSFETLLHSAHAPYIMFADQDDIWLPDKIQHAMEAMKECEKQHNQNTPIVVYSDLQVVDNHLNTIQPSFWNMAKIRPDLLKTPIKLASNNFVTGCTMLFNQASKKISLPFGKHALLHDAVIALTTLVHNGILVYNSHTDILYRQHNQNTIGANHVENNGKYIIYKLTHIPKILQTYERLYAQARDIFPISRLDFYINRFIYLLQR